METETSLATNQTEIAPAPVIEPAAQTEPQNQMAGKPDDDLIIITPNSVEIKREQQELSLEWAKKSNPNVMIDLMDEENTIIMKTEVNDENLTPNRFNAMERPIKRNVVMKTPKKPIVERCVGRICAPKKRPRLNNGTIATGGADESENEMISDSVDEIVSQADGRTDNEPGIIDATGVNLVAIAFQQAVNSISNVQRCQQCGSFHTSKKALQLHYKTKKHTSKVLELAREAARKLDSTISSESKASITQKDYY